MKPRLHPPPAPRPPICPLHSSFTPDCLTCCPRPKPEGWIATEAVAVTLCREAIATAKALGHSLTSWAEPTPGVLRARCYNHGCCAPAVLRVRQWHGATLAGEALTFRCEGTRR